jgi:hypothetical protein
VLFSADNRYSILPALSISDGIFHVDVLKGSYNMTEFKRFIMDLLLLMNRYDPINHAPNSVIVLDNCQIHKDQDLLDFIEES